MVLTNEQQQRYDEQGFLVVPGVLSEQRLADMQAEVEDLHHRMHEDPHPDVGIAWEEESEIPRIRQLMNSELICQSIDAAIRDTDLLDLVEQLIGPDIMLFHSKLMMKAAGDGSFTPWHQDWGYWQHHSLRPTQLNCMIAIDPQTEENGCIRFVLGTHKDGPIDHHRSDATSFNIGLPGDLDAYASVPAVMQPGDAVFFGPLVIHGSVPNNSTAHRRANTIAFDVPGNHRPELPPGRLLRGVYQGDMVDGLYSSVR